MAIKVKKKSITLEIDGEDVAILSDICEMIRIVSDSRTRKEEFSCFRSRLSHAIDWEKAKNFMHKFFNEAE